jgi:hypothetical protein
MNIEAKEIEAIAVPMAKYALVASLSRERTLMRSGETRRSQKRLSIW